MTQKQQERQGLTKILNTKNKKGEKSERRAKNVRWK